MYKIHTMVSSVTQNQTIWNAKSSEPQESLLLIKLVDAMEFQLLLLSRFSRLRLCATH